MLTFKIEDKEFETKFLEYVKVKKQTIEDVALDAINKLIDTSKKKLVYKVKDPLKHLHKVNYNYDEDISDGLDDVKPYNHIENSAVYVHNLRRKKKTL